MAAILQPITAPQSFSQGSDADPWTFTGVVVDKCPNRTLVAFVMLEGNGSTGDRSVTGITYGGVGLVKLTDQDAPSWGGCEIWYLHDPVVGTASLVVDLNGVDKGVCAVIVGQQIDELVTSARLRTAVKTSGTGTSATVTVSGVTSDDLVFSGLHIDGTGHATAPGANQTELVDRDSAPTTNTGVVNTQLGADGGVMSNTWTGSNPYALIGSAFQGAPPGVTTGYSEFNGAGSATCDVFRIPGVDINDGTGFAAYALVRPRSIAVRSMSILEFRSESNLDRVLLEIDSSGNYGWANQSGAFLGNGYHYAQEELWTLVVWEKLASGGGGYSNVKLHVCEDPGGTPTWYHYDIGYDSDPDETINGIVSVSNFDFSALTGDIACWGVWNTNWIETSGSPDADLESVFSGWSTASLLGSAHPPFAHFELNNQGNAPDLAGNGCWHDSSTAPVISDVTVPWTFGAGGGTTTPKSITATVSSTSSFVRRTGKLVNATKATTATFVRRAGKIITATKATTATALKRVTKSITATQGKTVTLAATKVFPRVLNATSSSVSSAIKRVGKFANATSTSVATMTRIKALRKSITASVTSVLGSGGSSYSSVVSTDSPVAYWRLADLTDSSGGGRTLTAAVGGTVTQASSLIAGGGSTDAIEFTGTHTTGVTRADDATLSPSPNMSWECWIKPTPGGIGSSAMSIMKKGLHTLGTRSNGKLYWQVETPSGATWLDGTTTLASNTTYHIVGTAAAGTYRLYINGVEEPGSFSFETSITDNSSAFSIGGNVADATFVGVVDEVAFYNTALSGARILAHYNAGVSAGGSGGIIKQIGKKITATVSNTVSLTATRVFLKALSAVSASVLGGGGGGSTAVRNFDGSDDIIKFPAPTWWDNSAMTFVAVVKREVPTDWEGIFSIGGTSGNPYVVWEFGSNTGTYGMEYVVNGSTHVYQQDPTLWQVTNWRLVAVSVPPQGGVIRFHSFDGTTWTHLNGGSTSVSPIDWTGATGIEMRFGNWDGSFNFIDGSIAVQAWWEGAALNDAQIEALAGGDKDDWVALGADHLWELNQASTATGVTDYVGSLNQIGLVGTTVVTGDPPPTGMYDFGSATGGGIIKRVGKIFNLTSAVTATIVRLPNRVLSVVSPTVSTVAKRVTKTINATVSKVVSLAATKVLMKAISATVANTTTAVKRVGKFANATSSSTSIFVKRVGKAITRTATSVATITKGQAQTLSATAISVTSSTLSYMRVSLKTLTATVGNTAGFVKRIGKPVTSISTSVTTSAKRITKSFSRTVTSVSTLVRTNVQTVVLSVARPVVATLTRTSTRVRSLTAVSNTISTIRRAISKPIFVQSAINASINKLNGKVLSATSASVARVTKTPRKVLSATVTTISSILRQKHGFVGVETTYRMLRKVVSIFKSVPPGSVTTTEESLQAKSEPLVFDIAVVNKSIAVDETSEGNYALHTVSTTESSEAVR